VEFSQEGVISDFSASLLTMGEPDGSSFPSGGLRTTASARGYTVWDMSSPVYLKPSANGLTLVIPTIFLSWAGESLDHKTPLLRSCDRLNQSVTRTLKLAGYADVESAYPTLGAEQEYFLIDRGFYMQRPDLMSCGRTLFGAVAPKNQQLEDHYFGQLNPRAIAYMQDSERQLWRMGVPVKTRHCEVAPGQFETAPIFEPATVASDHNLLEMEIMRNTARKHGLEFIGHEKPFAGVNGSGKHNNYSIATNNGLNLFEPGPNPFSNYAFLLALAAVVRGVDLHGDVLRAAIAIPANDFRLGANEAPPAIMSIYLGDALEDLVSRVCNGELDSENPGKPSLKTAAKEALHGREFGGGVSTSLETGTNLCPEVNRNTADRNRTSAFPFVGNKFEFRAVGSSQNCAVPVSVINCFMAEGMDVLHDAIQAKLAAGSPLKEAICTVVRLTLTAHRRIVFNGNGYAKEWAEEAAKRGLPNLRNAVDALPRWTEPKTVQLFNGVLSPAELLARREVGLETYIKVVDIEAKTSLDMWRTGFLPAASAHQARLADSIAKARSALAGLKGVEGALLPQEESFKDFVEALGKAIAAANHLASAVANEPHDHSDLLRVATYSRDHIRTAQKELRHHVDHLEHLVADELWPFPKYREMLANF
jgi:glutamine synthetase